MAFKRHRMEKVNGFGAVAMESATLSSWMYVTADAIATVAAADYFNEMADKGVQVGDIVAVMASDGPQLFKVSANDGATVTVKKYGAVRGQSVTVAASDTIVTGLTHVVAVVAQLDDDPVDGCMHVTASIGDQAGAPAAGSFLQKTWKSTDADATLIAATTFGKKVNWVAFGY
jgi:hypothetical protein